MTIGAGYSGVESTWWGIDGGLFVLMPDDDMPDAAYVGELENSPRTAGAYLRS